MADVQHSGLTDPNLHEPKGASTATTNQTYVSNGAGSGSWSEPEPKGVRGAAADKIYVTDGANSGAFHTTADITRTGIYDYNDLATATTPITLTPLSTWITLTNDGLGPNTNLNYPLEDVADTWSTSTDRFDFTGLNLGDWVDIRFDATVTTTAANTVISFGMELGLGGSPYTIDLGNSYFKSAGTYQGIRYIGFYMGDTNTLNNPARAIAQSDAGTATVQVNGWYIKAAKRGLIT